jgi:hypothetical protein
MCCFPGSDNGTSGGGGLVDEEETIACPLSALLLLGGCALLLKVVRSMSAHVGWWGSPARISLVHRREFIIYTAARCCCSWAP